MRLHCGCRCSLPTPISMWVCCRMTRWIALCYTRPVLAREENMLPLHESDGVHCAVQVAAATRGCPANLQAMQDLHGFQRMTQFLQWAALTFPSRCWSSSWSLHS